MKLSENFAVSIIMNYIYSFMIHGGLPYMKIIRHFLMAAGLTMGLMANSVYAETEQV